jgi:hypothetical protein
MDITFGPDNGDNGAWARLGSSRPNAASIRSQLDSCTDQPTTDDIVSLNNGQVSSAAKQLVDMVTASTDTWDTSEWGAQPARSSRSGISAANYGKVYYTEIIVFEDPENCSNTSFNDTGLEVKGFATAAIWDVDTSGSAAQRKIRMKITCSANDEPAGGGFFGTRGRSRLVQ